MKHLRVDQLFACCLTESILDGCCKIRQEVPPPLLSLKRGWIRLAVGESIITCAERPTTLWENAGTLPRPSPPKFLGGMTVLLAGSAIMLMAVPLTVARRPPRSSHFGETAAPKCSAPPPPTCERKMTKPPRVTPSFILMGDWRLRSVNLVFFALIFPTDSTTRLVRVLFGSRSARQYWSLQRL